MVIHVLIADDHEIVRIGLEMLISAEPDLDVVGLAADGLEAVNLALELAPDVVLMDLSMPRLDGLSAMAEIRATRPGCRLIAFTTDGRPHVVRRALAGGADGYLLKESSPAEVLAGIRAVHAGARPMSPAAAFSRIW